MTEAETAGLLGDVPRIFPINGRPVIRTRPGEPFIMPSWLSSMRPDGLARPAIFLMAEKDEIVRIWLAHRGRFSA